MVFIGLFWCMYLALHHPINSMYSVYSILRALSVYVHGSFDVCTWLFWCMYMALYHPINITYTPHNLDGMCVRRSKEPHVYVKRTPCRCQKSPMYTSKDVLHAPYSLDAMCVRRHVRIHRHIPCVIHRHIACVIHRHIPWKFHAVYLIFTGWCIHGHIPSKVLQKHIQPIADSVAQNLEMISKTFSTN